MKYLLTSSFICLALIFNGCKSTKSGINNSKIICVLFDLSETTNTTSIRNAYLQNFKTIVNTLHPGDAIKVALITEKSISEQFLSIELELPLFEPGTDNPMLIKGERKIAEEEAGVKKDSIIAVADSVLLKSNRKIMNTEILSSLDIAERIFKSFPQPRKILVIFSDMIEDSKNYNFARENLKPSRIEQIINNEKRKNLIPDLNKVKVYVAGANAKSTDRFNKIQNFWLEYFKETGANLAPENYGAALIRFDE